MPLKTERAAIGNTNYVYLLTYDNERLVLRINTDGNDYSETARLL